MFSEKSELKILCQERVKRKSPVKKSWVVTVGLALKWGYMTVQTRWTISIAKGYLTVSLSLLPNWEAMEEPCWARDLQPTRWRPLLSCSIHAGQKQALREPVGTGGKVGSTTQFFPMRGVRVNSAPQTFLFLQKNSNKIALLCIYLGHSWGAGGGWQKGQRSNLWELSQRCSPSSWRQATGRSGSLSAGSKGWPPPGALCFSPCQYSQQGNGGGGGAALGGCTAAGLLSSGRSLGLLE